MSATNTTPNIGLPSFIGTDKPAWLTDWNGAMSTIDTEIGTIKTGVSGDETRIGNLENSVSSLNTTVSNHTTSITALNTQVATQGGTINTITSLIGNGTPTTTDQTIIGAINELHADQGDLANLVTTDKSSFVAAINEVAGGGGGSIAASAVSYDNTTSGLTANNVQAAIDEIAQGAGTSGFVFTHFNDSVSITTDGSHTFGEELNKLVNAFMTALALEPNGVGYKICAAAIGDPLAELTGRSEVVMKGESFTDIIMSGAGAYAPGTVVGEIRTVTLSSTVANCAYDQTIMRASSNEHTTTTSQTVGAGNTWTLYFDKVKSV